MSDLEYLFETYSTSVFEKDLSTFLSLYDDEVRIFDAWEKWSYEGLAGWQKMVEGWFASLGENRDRVSFEEVQIHEGEGVAAVSCYGRFGAIAPSGEELRFLYNRLTWFIHKKEGRWKIVHQHTSFPIDGNSMKPMMDRLL